MNIKNKISKSFIVNEIKTFFYWNKLRPVNCYPHGHYYSPIVSKNDIVSFEKQIWEEESQNSIAGIDLNVNEQLLLLKEFSKYYPDLFFTDTKSEKNRYFYENRSYKYTDAIMLFSFIRHFKPQKIIEIGSGFSSALMLDTKDAFHMDVNLTFIEPYPNLLYSLFRGKDKTCCRIFDTKVQNVEIDLFRSLKENDILFIDSSHISKTGSDVNFEIFKILPSLNPGVIIHFHDVFYPFEYPKEWVNEGKNWNEDYLLRAFLSYNNKFKIELFSSYIHQHHASAFKQMPLAYKNKGGSLWIRKM